MSDREETVMILDVPEILIIALTAVLFWIGGRDWLTRARTRRRR
jgi:hypothetical protein